MCPTRRGTELSRFWLRVGLRKSERTTHPPSRSKSILRGSDDLRLLTGDVRQWCRRILAFRRERGFTCRCSGRTCEERASVHREHSLPCSRFECRSAHQTSPDAPDRVGDSASTRGPAGSSRGLRLHRGMLRRGGVQMPIVWSAPPDLGHHLGSCTVSIWSADTLTMV